MLIIDYKTTVLRLRFVSVFVVVANLLSHKRLVSPELDPLFYRCAHGENEPSCWKKTGKNCSDKIGTHFFSFFFVFRTRALFSFYFGEIN